MSVRLPPSSTQLSVLSRALRTSSRQDTHQVSFCLLVHELRSLVTTERIMVKDKLVVEIDD